MRIERHLRNYRRCAIGCTLFVLAFAFQAEGSARPNPKPFIVAFYNLENYIPPDGEANPSGPQKSEESLDALTAVVTTVSPQILGVCEIGGPEMLEDLRLRLKKAGLELPHTAWVDAADSSRRVALLSAFPIVAKNSRTDVPFELGGQRHRILRGILDVTVEVVPGFQLRLIGAHLKSRRANPFLDQAQFRAKEAWHLRHHVNRILDEDPDINLMLFGDLNDTKNEYPVRELIGTRGTPRYLFDIWLTDSRGDRWTHYWRTADSYSRIDYIMASPGLVRYLDLKKSGICDIPLWNTASDHRLVYAVIDPSKQ